MDVPKNGSAVGIFDCGASSIYSLTTIIIIEESQLFCILRPSVISRNIIINPCGGGTWRGRVLTPRWPANQAL